MLCNGSQRHSAISAEERVRVACIDHIATWQRHACRILSPQVRMLWTCVSSTRGMCQRKTLIEDFWLPFAWSLLYLGRVPHGAETYLDIQTSIDLGAESCTALKTSYLDYLGCRLPTFDVNCPPGGIWRVCWLGRVGGGEWDNWVWDKLYNKNINLAAFDILFLMEWGVHTSCYFNLTSVCFDR